jgi:MFS family permease
VLAIRFSDRLGKGIRGAPRDAMLAEFAPEGQRGRVYGFHRAMDHAGAVLGPLLATAYLYFYPEDYRTLFALTLIPGIIVIVIILFIPEASSRSTSEGPRREPWRLAPAPIPPIGSLGPLVRPLAVIFLFALGNASDAFLLLRLSEVGIAAVWIPLLWAGLHVVKVASSIAGGALSDRVGRRSLIAAGWIFYAAVYGAFAFVEAAASLVAIFLAYGIFFGLTEGVEKAWVADLAPPARRGIAFGYYNAAIGLGALLASVIFGLIWTRVSPQAAFLTGSAIAVAATLLLYFAFPHETDSGHQ